MTTHKKYEDDFLCPCCGYPTLSARAQYEICLLCFWEDDGQDDVDADAVAGGPNSDYSLTEARENFRKYYTMYRPEDKGKFEMTTARKDIAGNILVDKVAIKKSMMEKYKQLYLQTDPGEKARLRMEISQLGKQLF